MLKNNLISLCLTLILVLSFVNSVSAITLVDESIDYGKHSSETISSSELIKDITSHNKLLIKNSFDYKEIHVFDMGTDKYSHSYMITKKQMQRIILPELENEAYRYKTAGFKELPSKHVSNVQNYDWYIDQWDTKKHPSINCGPSSTAMAINWYNGKNTTTADKARSELRPEGGCWDTLDVENYLKNYEVEILTPRIKNEDDLINIIDQESIAILCIDMKYIESNYNNSSRIGRFYSFNGGHFVVLTGYLKTKNKVYFEVYDPNTRGSTVKSKGIPLGKGRFFESDDLLDAITKWSKYAIVIINPYC